MAGKSIQNLTRLLSGCQCADCKKQLLEAARDFDNLLHLSIKAQEFHLFTIT